MAQQALSVLLEYVYDGVLDDARWPQLLSQLQTTLSADTACLMVDALGETPQPQLLYAGGCNASIDRYRQSLYAQDPFADLPDGTVVRIEEVVADADWRGSAFYRECVAPAGLHYFAGVDRRCEPYGRLRLRVGRSPSGGGFSSAQCQLLQELAGHLHRAFLLKLKLGLDQQQLQEHQRTLRRLSLGTLALNRQGEVMYASDIARDMLRAHAQLTLRGPRLHFRQRNAQGAFDQALATCLATRAPNTPGTVEFLRLEDSTEPLGLALRPAVDAADAIDSCAAGTASALSMPGVRCWVQLSRLRGAHPAEANADAATTDEAPALANALGLTPTEARLSLLLSRGLTLGRATEQLGMKLNTGRAHLRSIFVKLAVSSQSQLVSAVNRATAAL
ncbi:hypothetical protein [Parahaliea mediterranea]|uniref:hypothetical protein n=1 Tax=Parahaliea mediterranea TaxID=651086 RepID=UPI000E2FF242|nr:hypothetical protein [Parahaliea mediterranea]